MAVGVVAPAFARADTIVGLRGRDDARLTRQLARQTDPASADFGHWLTREEFAARFGASARSVRRVSRWLRAAGCVGVQRARGRQLLRCRHGRVGAPPPGIAKLVDGVFDTAGFTVTRDRLAPEPASRGAAGQFYFSPAEFARTYGLDRGHAAALDGRGITVGLLAASQINVDDIAAFRTLFGLPPADVVQSSGSRTGDIAEAEAVLDATWAGAVAPAARVQLAVVTSTMQAYDLLIASNAPDVISSSIDVCPSTPAARAQSNRVLRRVFRQARAQGQAILVASGDRGPSDCACGGFGLLASSPLVTAVGGTMPAPVLDANGTATGYGTESVWNDGAGASSGGGRTTFPRPLYQRGVGRRRTIPDVAFPASSVYPIILRGQRLLVGGTSAAAPAWAGVVARVAQLRGRRVGFLNPALYRLGRVQQRGGTAVFHDVVTGNNGGFAAGPGYDLATGWGSIDGAALFDALAAR